MLDLSTIRRAFAILLVVLPIYPQCALSEPQSAKSDAARLNNKATETRIDGAGSTTIYPLLSAWIDEYSRLHPGIRFSYRAIGSKAGIRLLTDRTMFFAATDVPESDDQLILAKGRILHFPVALNAVVPVYNLAQVPGLRFSGTTLADIFLGKITKWNDPAIANDNPGVALPGMDITVKHYFPHGNGDVETFVMADYLSKRSPVFKAALTNSLGNWPVDSPRYKEAEVAGFFRETPGSVGYLNLLVARQNGLKYGAVKNSDGEFVTASSESVTAASASGVSSIRDQAPDFRTSITDAPGKKSYPIVSFIWLLLYEDSKEKRENEVINDFLKWVLTDGQKLAPKLGYPPLPGDLVEIELQRLGIGETENSSR